MSRTADDISLSSDRFCFVSFKDRIPKATGHSLHMGDLLVPNRGSFGQRAGDGGVQTPTLFAVP